MAVTISRNKEHELIMTSIYDALIYIDSNEEFSVENIMEAVFEMPYAEIPTFSKEIVVKSFIHLNEIINAFQNNMPKWKFERLNTLERAILIMSYTNYKVVGSVDKSVVINVAVTLSKRYLGDNDYKFVNGILDNVL